MKIVIGTILTISLCFGSEIVKVSSNIIPLTKDVSEKEMNLYSLNPSVAFEKNKFQSCIIQENKRLNEINLLCNKEAETLVGKINGKINPDGNLFINETFIKLKDFNKEVEKLKKGE